MQTRTVPVDFDATMVSDANHHATLAHPRGEFADTVETRELL